MTETVSVEQYKALTSNKGPSRRRPSAPYIEGRDPLEVLMAYSKLPMRMDLGPEDRLSILLADCLRVLSKQKLLIAVWLHIPNEAKRHEFVAMLLKRMGMLPGATDFIFAGENRSAWIELKVKPNTLSANQQYFRDWCRSLNVPWACFTCRADTYEDRKATVTEILDKLHQWGFIPNTEGALAACQTLLLNPYRSTP